METIEHIQKRYELLKPIINERLRRLRSAAEAKVIGQGGIGLVAQATAQSRTTIASGIKELAAADKQAMTGVRKVGGGRQKIVAKTPAVEAELLQLIEPTVRGEPESPLLWTTKSLRTISAELLKKNDFGLLANRKSDEGRSHPDRDAQFQYIHDKLIEFQSANQPIISVDTKKKELVGNFKNQERAWQRNGEDDRVKVCDFPSDAAGKTIPYGIDDMTQNAGWVSVGTNHDIAEFAVETIRNWWYKMGTRVYHHATQLLITADCYGGSNGSKVRLWKKEIQDFANARIFDNRKTEKIFISF